MSDTHSDSLSRHKSLPAWLKAVLDFFSPKRRIGRLRFVLYVMLWPVGSATLLTGMEFAVLSWHAFDYDRDVLTTWVVFLLFLPSMLMFMIFLIQRLHDISISGWFSLTMIIAFVFPYLLLLAAILALIPGASDENRYGPVPAPNGLGVKLGFASLLPVFFLFVTFVYLSAPDGA